MREELRTERLLLRRPRTEDSEAMTAAIDENVVKLLGNMPWPYKEKDSLDFIRKDKKNWGKKGFNFVIMFKGELVGGISLKRYSPKHKRADLGYWLVKKHWGQGLTTEAAKAVLEFAFTDVGMIKVSSGASPKNPGSYRVLEKVGMTRLCTMKKDYKTPSGKWEDCYYYEILNEEWQAFKD